MTPKSLSAPTQDTALVLDSNQEGFFEGLDALGRLKVRASNVLGSLESIRQVQAPVKMEEASELFFPEMGLNLCVADGLSAHGTLRERPERELTLELDPLPHADRLSFSAPLESRSGLELEGYMRQWALKEVQVDQLDEWRKRARKSLNMCPCCAKAATRRAARPQTHPLYWILKYAQINYLILNVRLMSSQVDFSVEMLPEEVEIRGGNIVVEEVCETTLNLNLYFAHALALKECWMDGEQRGVLHVYNSHGHRVLEISSSGPQVLSHWRAICEAAK